MKARPLNKLLSKVRHVANDWGYNETYRNFPLEGTFATYSFWVSVAPLYLYVVGVYETNVVSNILYFAAGTIISALTLYHLYGLVAIGKKNSLMEHG